MKTKYLGIEIDYSRDNDLPEQGKVMLTKKGFYKLEHENSPQETFARAATSYCFGDYELAQRLYDAASKHHFSFASPVLSNSSEIHWQEGLTFEEHAEWLRKNVKPKGLPISCFLSYIPDTKEGLVSSSSETRWLSMNGGGIGIYPAMRAPDAKSTGVMAHMRSYDADALAYKQTESRRGSIAAYLPINHPEIISFMEMRNPVGGDANKKCFNLNNGVTITDDFMYALMRDEDIELIDPKHGNTGRFVSAKEIWNKLMNLRFETGEPFIAYIDTINKNLPSWISRPLYKVNQSNLCSEITLMTSTTRTAVCCLSSLNLEKYEEWKDTGLVADLIKMLDNVLEYFIQLAPKEMSRAVHSAKQERALGLGTLGLHSLMQSKNIAFESGGFNSATQLINQVYKNIRQQAVSASQTLARERGEAPDCAGQRMRNSHLLAIAPNASTASLLGTSPSKEMWSANAFTSKGRAGIFLIKNKYLEKVLAKHGKNTKEIWNDILEKGGSVQHLDFLTEHEKNVFKTAYEVEQRWVIEHTASIQQYICQAQSTNIFLRKGTTAQYMSDLHFYSWLKGVKTLYYCRTEPPLEARVTASEAPTEPLNSVQPPKFEMSECFNCEG